MKHADPRALDHRFTIGRVLVQSWRAFAANRWPFLAIAAITSAILITYGRLTEDIDYYGSQWSFFSYVWISSVVQSLAIIPITISILQPRSERSGIVIAIRSLRSMLRVAFANCILQTVAYWPVSIFIGSFTARAHSEISFAVIAVNAVAVGTFLNLFFPILLIEKCSLRTTSARSVSQVMPHVWRVAALTILYYLVYLGGSATILLATNAFNTSELDWTYYALWWPFVGLLVLAPNIVSAVSYQLLRIEREGPDPGHVAHVFE